VAGAWAARSITRPINRLTEAAAAFAAGDRQARANVDSPGEIGELARTFDDAVEKVASEERARRNLSADVAHELRTPLTALLAGLEEVRDGYMPADDATLTGLHDQALRLQRVVSDLADLAAAEAPSPTRLAKVDLAVLAEESARSRGAQLRAAGIQLSTQASAPVWVTGDPDRIDQIIGNLLSNVARYCPEGATVTVRTLSAGGAGVLEVQDTGPGVAADDLPRLFDRFWRGSSASGGSGIGLAIVSELVRAQHGTVVAESNGTTGLLVRVTLPGA
jgi:two-component system, OmpR family, sensor histidine kinase BaeS